MVPADVGKHVGKHVGSTGGRILSLSFMLGTLFSMGLSHSRVMFSAPRMEEIVDSREAGTRKIGILEDLSCKSLYVQDKKSRKVILGRGG